MKRKFAILLVLVLALSACAFSLAACDEEPEEVDRFALYGIDRLITEYEYSYVRIDEWNEGEEAWQDMMPRYDLEDLYYIQHYVGDDPYALEMRSFIETVGGQIRVGMEETDFSGELGEIPSALVPESSGRASLKLNPLTEQSEMMANISNPISLEHNGPSTVNPTLDAVWLKIWFSNIEIEGRMCRFRIWYAADCDCTIRGDSIVK